MIITERAQELQSEIINDRRHIHAHPELSFEEYETADLSAKRLAALGYNVKRGIGKTGVVGDIGHGKRIAIRADMDALPIQEANQASYSSTKTGVMHACGHDAHVACALAAAKLLTQTEFPGSIRMLMQPSEEAGDAEHKSGAARMIEDGAMKGIDAVIGLHVYTPVPAGKVAIMPGPVFAAHETFLITINGQGGHGAYPHQTIDSIALATVVISAIQHIVSRRIDPIEPAVVTIGSIHSSSDRGNIISEQVTLRGTLRCFNEETRIKLMDELDKACSLVTTFGGSYKIEYEFGYPATINHPQVTEIMRQAAIDIIGIDNVLTIPPPMGSEDFSLLAQEAPGAFLFLGAGMTNDLRSHHSAKFEIDESKLYFGAAILAETAKRLLVAA